ncbi:GNAT family N-acetyltransferase [Flavobacterium kingsejongi]|uniref:N-acetyltransferase domain-containing protein n=1 Tax=Flavobacterium kingsejongi TaxID=1678728 RepID=A0A2S1LKW1_9FLAO|nr:GNAT family N-acetyltransferase [Flavobacterium kingsejongi]AWG24413.1 hypothetical protein FK004_03775 [Flavobacterium kingsejongi]
MRLSTTTSLSPAQKEHLLQLWNTEYPEKLRYATISGLEAYLNGLAQAEHHLIEEESGKILGWAVTFLRESGTWFAIILNHTIQKQGHGRILLNRIKARHRVLNGWVIDHDNDRKSDGTSYRSPLEFYRKEGFVACPELRLETPQLSALKITWEATAKV